MLTVLSLLQSAKDILQLSAWVYTYLPDKLKKSKRFGSGVEPWSSKKTELKN
jgi:hypothetical protein